MKSYKNLANLPILRLTPVNLALRALWKVGKTTTLPDASHGMAQPISKR